MVPPHGITGVGGKGSTNEGLLGTNIAQTIDMVGF